MAKQNVVIYSKPPPLHTVYVYTVYLFTQGRGEGEEELSQRELERGNSSQSWVEKTNMTDCISSLPKLW
jgi:hypothetical protein